MLISHTEINYYPSSEIAQFLSVSKVQNLISETAICKDSLRSDNRCTKIIREIRFYHSMTAASAQDDGWICLDISSFVFQSDHLAETRATKIG